jgi:O-antigen/teichoic acid export membrane protein
MPMLGRSFPGLMNGMVLGGISMSFNTSMVKSVAALASGNLIGTFLTAAGGLLIARYVEPEINGQFRAFTIPLMYLTFLHLGTFDGLYRQIPFYTGKKELYQVDRIASASGAWNAFIAFIVSLGFLFCVFRALYNNNYIDAAGWLTQVLASIGIFYGGYLSATYRTLNHFVTLSGIQLIQSIIGFCLVLAVVIFEFYGLCLRFAIPIVFCVLLYHRFRPLRGSLHFDLLDFKDVVRVGMPLCFWGTLYTSAWVAAEFSLILNYGGFVVVGLFSVAVMMRESFSILPQAVNQVLMPRMIESFARRGDVKSAAKETLFGTVMFAMFMICLVLIVNYLLNYFVPLVIPKYVEGLTLMKACLWFAVIHAISLPLHSLVATGRSWLYGKSILIGILAFIFSFYTLNPIQGGVMATIYASLIGRLVRTFVAYVDLFALMRLESE